MDLVLGEVAAVSRNQQTSQCLPALPLPGVNFDPGLQLLCLLGLAAEEGRVGQQGGPGGPHWGAGPSPSLALPRESRW